MIAEAQGLQVSSDEEEEDEEEEEAMEQGEVSSVPLIDFMSRVKGKIMGKCEQRVWLCLLLQKGEEVDDTDDDDDFEEDDDDDDEGEYPGEDYGSIHWLWDRVTVAVHDHYHTCVIAGLGKKAGASVGGAESYDFSVMDTELEEAKVR